MTMNAHQQPTKPQHGPAPHPRLRDVGVVDVVGVVVLVVVADVVVVGVVVGVEVAVVEIPPAYIQP